MDVYLPRGGTVPPEEFVEQTESVIIRAAGRGGCVLLGRAAAEMPPGWERSTPTGTPDREAERMLDDNDRARTAYVKHFYGADPADPRLYHLVIDSTRLPVPATVELIVVAARAF
ncbi:AAA family ATPase [Actinomadura madurae]|uniref:cytidylate kinase-like family protein n=1 Tax=Actinomadura madurae TaxID=1993 RepID=UPI000D9D53FD|nr:cytidylate kinase family protein [Actinomadura madurae]SPT59003.1 Uncharacterised protein [Actinomadura madurae]